MIHLTSQKEFDDILSTHDIVVLKYSTEWCGPCKQIQPIYEQLESQYPNVTFCIVQADIIDIQTDVTIWGYPTFVLFQRGNSVEKVTGAKATLLEQYLNEYSQGKEKEDGLLSSVWRRYGF